MEDVKRPSSPTTTEKNTNPDLQDPLKPGNKDQPQVEEATHINATGQGTQGTTRQGGPAARTRLSDAVPPRLHNKALQPETHMTCRRSPTFPDFKGETYRQNCFDMAKTHDNFGTTGKTHENCRPTTIQVRQNSAPW